MTEGVERDVLTAADRHLKLSKGKRKMRQYSTSGHGGTLGAKSAAANGGSRAALPVLLLLAFRPEFDPPWIGQPHVTLLALGRLNRRDTRCEPRGDRAFPPRVVAQ
jgi:hypothetical protein